MYMTWGILVIFGKYYVNMIVRVRGKILEQKYAGVPHGSVIAPLRFLIITQINEEICSM